MQIRRPRDEQCVVDRDQVSAIVDEWTDFVHHTFAMIDEIDRSSASGGEKWGIEHNTIKPLVGTFEDINLGPKVTHLEIRFVNREAIE